MNGVGAMSDLSRRELLKRSGVLVGALAIPSALAAACGDNETTEDQGTTGSPGIVPGTVNYYSWQGEDFAPQTKSWRQANDVALKSVYYGDPSEFETKFLSGGGRGLYNLGTVCACFGERYEQLNLLTPIEVDRVPNFEEIYPFLQEGPLTTSWNFDGQVWAVPVTWGADSLLYDSSKIDEPESYEDLLQYAGEYAFYDDPWGSILIGARALGVGQPEEGLYSPDDLDQIFEWLGPLKEHARLIAGAGDIADLFGSREIVATTIAWFGIIEFAAQKDNSDVSFTIPGEGAYIFLDSYFVPPDAPDVDTVLAYINQVLTPEVQAEGAKALSAGVVRPDAVPLLDPATRALYPYEDLQGFFSGVGLLMHPPLEPPTGYVPYADVLQRWEEFKGS
jgi:spermidine/putrescine transport system substrate-binding protein